MVSVRIDLTGRRFGRLTVVRRGVDKFYGNYPYGRASWVCRCDCGTIKNIVGAQLGINFNSCGCGRADTARQRVTTHGMTGTPTYQTWFDMKRRCDAAVRKGHGADRKNYFSRGIRVCQEWLSFENFFADMGERPNGMTIDRIDNNKGYCKENCRWADSTTQNRNKSNVILVTIDNQSKPLVEWCEIFGIKAKTARQRISQYGWPAERAVREPVHT
jgi:hypothetical protein